MPPKAKPWPRRRCRSFPAEGARGNLHASRLERKRLVRPIFTGGRCAPFRSKPQIPWALLTSRASKARACAINTAAASAICASPSPIAATTVCLLPHRQRRRAVPSCLSPTTCAWRAFVAWHREDSPHRRRASTAQGPGRFRARTRATAHPEGSRSISRSPPTDTCWPRWPQPLADAGLSASPSRWTRSIPTRFARITRVPNATSGCWREFAPPQRVGLNPVKINCVLLRGFNDDQIIRLRPFAREEGVIVRFIEFMPLEEDRVWTPGDRRHARRNPARAWPNSCRCVEIGRTPQRNRAALPLRRRHRRNRHHRPRLPSLLRTLQPHPPHLRRQDPHLPLLRPRPRSLRRMKRGAIDDDLADFIRGVDAERSPPPHRRARLLPLENDGPYRRLVSEHRCRLRQIRSIDPFAQRIVHAQIAGSVNFHCPDCVVIGGGPSKRRGRNTASVAVN